MCLSRNCLISILAIIFLVAIGFGIYFTVSGGKSSPEVKPSPNQPPNNDMFLIKFNDGTITLYNHTDDNVKVKVEDKHFGITSFGPYLDQTIYYATTESKSIIRSTNNKDYPNLPQFTADWIKTAIAVDSVTKTIYVVDRIAKQINVVDGKLHYVLPLALNEPKDVILIPENGMMFILEEANLADSKIIMADMDGTNQTTLLTQNYIQALAVDKKNGFLYFAHRGGLESYDYLQSKKRFVLNTDVTDIQSLLYINMKLYFVNKKGKSNKNVGTSLDVCHLNNIKCLNKCCEIFIVYRNEQLDQVKTFEIEKPTKNPCEIKNGNCEQLCLLNTSAKGYSCQCETRFKLKPDNKTCEKLKS